MCYYHVSNEVGIKYVFKNLQGSESFRELSDQETDVGVITDSKLTFDKHINDKINNKANLV